jgi:thiopeptide-type bacteriocin biosynthesis protein
MSNESRIAEAFEPAAFFVLRAPLLSFDELLAWSDGLEARGAWEDPNHFESAVTADELRLRTRLQILMERSEVREAVFLASPSLDESIDVWIKSPDSRRGRRVEQSLVRYLMRMAGRAMPFGLFAGCSVGGWGASTSLVVPSEETIQRHTRMDTSLLVSVIDKLVRDPEIRKRLTYRPNRALYSVGTQVRYVEAREGPGGSRTHCLVSVEPTEHLSCALRSAEKGARETEIAARIVEFDPDVPREDASDYVTELIDSQILEPELAVAVTGNEPDNTLIHQLKKLSINEPAELLGRVRRALGELDNQPLGIAPSVYRELSGRLKDLSIDVDVKRLCQVDVFRGGPMPILGPEVLAGIREALAVFQRIVPRGAPEPLARFRDAFLERYDSREVPLVVALDEESGIGAKFAQTANAETSPLLQGLPFVHDDVTAPRSWNKAEQHLLGRLIDTLCAQSAELILDDGDIEALTQRPGAALPDAFCIKATIAARSQADIDRGEFLLHPEFVNGPSGANLLGRFCHTSSTLTDHVRQHLRAEESLRPQAIHAEVVHLPDWNAGNVVVRPLLRDYEIPCLGQSGAAPEKQILLTDLWVTVRGGRIVLRSHRLGREVVPRLTCAHNFQRRSLGIYKFLSLMQGQDSTSGPLWQWGALISSPFLPRVRFGRIVLAPARWRVNRKAFAISEESNRQERFVAGQRLREKYRWPRFVAALEGDAALPLDLDNVLCVDSLFQLMRTQEQVELIETIQPEDLCATGPKGRYTHEMIVPFIRSHAVQTAAALTTGESRTRPEVDFQRVFSPGSEWLYLKIYVGEGSVDRLLIDVLAPVVREALESGAADRWFFIRYGDPDWHIRIRLHGSPKRLYSEVLPQLHTAMKPLVERGEIARIQVDTYIREIERYGGHEAFWISEEVFQIDSEAVMGALECLRGDQGSEMRWQLTMRGIGQLLSDLGFDLAAKYDYMREWSNAKRKTFRQSGGLDYQIAAKYRRERGAVTDALRGSEGTEGPLHEAVRAFTLRSARLTPVVSRLRSLEADGRLETSFGELAASYAHMFTNRMLRSAGPEHEVVLYEFLARHYSSELARKKTSFMPVV